MFKDVLVAKQQTVILPSCYQKCSKLCKHDISGQVTMKIHPRERHWASEKEDKLPANNGCLDSGILNDPSAAFLFTVNYQDKFLFWMQTLISYTLVIWHRPLTIEQIAPWWLKMLRLVLEPLESFFVSLLPLLSPLSPLHPPLILPLSSLSLSPPSSQSHFLSIGKVASWWYADYSEKGSRQEKKRGNDLI